MLEINPGLSIWTFIIFGVLLLLLSKLGWRPMLDGLNKREQAIADALSKAENARTEAERLIAETERQRKQHEEDLQRQLREGKDYAERMRQEMITKSQEEARALLDNARKQIERDTRDALIALRDQAAEIAVSAAGKLIDENLTDAKNKQIVEKYIAELPSVKN
jgi:F-type H+-transporting ATPase subunit b